MLQLVIGNKNYSSWSFRPWLALKQAGIPFEETKIWIRKADSLKKIAKFSPGGRVPALADGKIQVWESLAILEYIAEKFPRKHLWPKDKRERAYARSISNEMHSGFSGLRSAMPFNCRAYIPLPEIPEQAEADVKRIHEIWTDCRKAHGRQGPFLFGKFTVADAMYAPIALRFKTYGILLTGEAGAYIETIAGLDATREWVKAAIAEKEVIPESEITPPPIKA